MASIVEQDPDSKTESPASLASVRHGYCSCQETAPIQTAMCGYVSAETKSFADADKTPPDGACVVCLDLMYAPRVCCGLGII